jgi:hypothetical protein
MLALVLSLSLAASQNVRVTYELKCLYCHSAEVTERVRLTEDKWVKLVEKMRKKAPLLITRQDVKAIARFMVHDKGLGVKESRVAAKPAAPPVAEPKPFEPPPLPAPEPPNEALKEPPPEPTKSPAELEAEQQQLEQQGFALMKHRCSKCHTISRVYSKLNDLESALSTIERMELKTGSGITEKDAELLERFVRAQFSE